jgi:uncharacterized membrane-anchored protein
MFTPHPLRDAVLRELHARPFTPLETPRRVLHYAFLTDSAQAAADRGALVALCTARGMTPPAPGAKHHRCGFDGGALRWESHAEFSTYTWELPAGADAFDPPADKIDAPMGLVPQPGPLLVAIDLHLAAEGAADPARLFDAASLVRARVFDGTAEIATDFQPKADYVRILVLDHGLGPDRAGALVQRLLELETYRTLALLGLPEAQRLAPAVRRIEAELAAVTQEMRGTLGLSANHQLHDKLTALAAELEAQSAASLFRFGASRAYHEIVRLRLQTIGEQPVRNFPTWSQFLERRLAPAMRTCANIEERQENMSRRLARAAQLLRTRVELDLERQNRDLLTTMNERARMQLRLQQTVEGLSVAAISYYLIGLVHYVFEGAAKAGVKLDPTTATAVAVPFAVLAVALVVRRIRRRYDEATAPPAGGD